MRGAITEPCVITRTLLNNMSRMMIGSNQNFFRSFMNAHNSDNIFNMSILLQIKIATTCENPLTNRGHIPMAAKILPTINPKGRYCFISLSMPRPFLFPYQTS